MENAITMVERVAQERGMDSKAYLETLAAGPLSGMNREQAHVALGDIHRTGLCPLSDELLFLKKGGKYTTTIRYGGMTRLMRRKGITHVDVTYVTHEDGDVECRAVLGKTNEDGVVESFCRPEFLSECKQGNQVWEKYPRKMLGHRAVMQSARLACDINLPSADEYLEAGFVSPDKPQADGGGFKILGGAE